jgi:hypothetical protein
VWFYYFFSFDFFSSERHVPQTNVCGACDNGLLKATCAGAWISAILVMIALVIALGGICYLWLAGNSDLIIQSRL